MVPLLLVVTLMRFQDTVPHMAATKMSTVSGWSGSVKQTGFCGKFGGCLVTSRTSRQLLGLVSAPMGGSVYVMMGRGT